MADTIATIANAVTSATGTAPSAGSGVPTTSAANKASLAGNFDTFLRILTTQLKNQNPLDPLDTNQFTQQLVQFAGVEQQLRTNDQLSALLSLQQTAQSTQALTFVGKTAVVDGDTAALSHGLATWNLSVPTDSNVNIAITNSAGQTVFTNSYAVSAGSNQAFGWDGKNNDGSVLPDGQYKLTATAADSAGNSVAVSKQIQGVVSSVDLTQ